MVEWCVGRMGKEARDVGGYRSKLRSALRLLGECEEKLDTYTPTKTAENDSNPLSAHPPTTILFFGSLSIQHFTK